MRGLTRARWVAGAALVALAVTACGGGDDPEGSPSEGTSSEAPQGGTLNVYAGEPAFLFPAMTNETSGGAVLNALFSPLIDYDPETGDPVPVMATEVPTSEDNINWTITINDGWTFHNGDPVTSADVKFSPSHRRTSRGLSGSGLISRASEAGVITSGATVMHRPPSMRVILIFTPS